MSQASSERTSTDRLIIHDLARADARLNFDEDVRAGLSSEPKRLFPKYFYDALGSQLFEAICLLPEYYLTRAENEILTRHADEIVREVDGENLSLIEMGSGSASKTRLIIEALLRRQRELLFIPVDISANTLETSSRVLLQSYPNLRIEAYAGDYFDGLAALSEVQRERTLALFLGSNIGNFDAPEAQAFLRALRRVLKANDALLLGADLRKSPEVLEAAYDDSLGVTAAFNLNQLVRINRELDADFDIEAFGHVARWNATEERIEMWLRAATGQRVRIEALDLTVNFAAGEEMLTEVSCKFRPESVTAELSAAGLRQIHWWTDATADFGLSLAVK